MTIETASRNYRIIINSQPLDDLFTHLSSDTHPAPKISLADKVDIKEIEELPQSWFKNLLYKLLDLRGIFTAHAQQKSETNEILLFTPNWPDTFFKNVFTLKSEIIEILAHEYGHALGHVPKPPSFAGKIHKLASSPIFNYSFVILLFLALNYKRLHYIGTLSNFFDFFIMALISIPFFTIELILFSLIGVCISIMIKEVSAESIGRRLLKKYEQEFLTSVTVTEIKDA